MKDEYGGKSIVKFVGLKSKMYSILDESNNKNEHKRGSQCFYRVSRIPRHIISEKDSQAHNERNTA